MVEKVCLHLCGRVKKLDAPACPYGSVGTGRQGLTLITHDFFIIVVVRRNVIARDVIARDVIARRSRSNPEATSKQPPPDIYSTL